ncbi:MAG: hypothetical protein AAF141_11855 [Pseudomonadota bacterium]
MKALGLVLLFAGFIAWGALTFWLPASTGDVVASRAFENGAMKVEMDLSADDAPLHIVLAIDHLVPTNVASSNRLVNGYSLQLLAPDGLIIDHSASLAVTASNRNRGSRTIANLNMMTLDEVQTGTYTVLLFEDSEPVLETFNLGVVAISKAQETPAWTNLAALALGGLGVVLLIGSQIGGRAPRLAKGGSEKRTDPMTANPPRKRRRWGRQPRG